MGELIIKRCDHCGTIVDNERRPPRFWLTLELKDNAKSIGKPTPEGKFEACSAACAVAVVIAATHKGFPTDSKVSAQREMKGGD